MFYLSTIILSVTESFEEINALLHWVLCSYLPWCRNDCTEFHYCYVTVWAEYAFSVNSILVLMGASPLLLMAKWPISFFSRCSSIILYCYVPIHSLQVPWHLWYQTFLSPARVEPHWSMSQSHKELRQKYVTLWECFVGGFQL